MKKEYDYISSLRNSDKKAFEYLYNLWSGKVYNFVMRISDGNEFMAEETVQVVFVKLWENRTAVNPDKFFEAYLYTIARNALFDMYHERMREILSDDLGSVNKEAENSTEEQVNYHLLDEYIGSLIKELPPVRKKIFIMSREMHFSNKKIAEMLHLSENTIESQLRKANLFLKANLAKYYNESDKKPK